MATPSYKGPQMMSAGASWFGSWLNSTPMYAGAGNSTATASMFGSSAPAYKPAPTTSAAEQVADDADGCGPTAFAIVVPRQ